MDSVGGVPDACIDRLFVAYEQELIFSDGYLGWHDCELCSGEERHSPEADVGPVVEWKGRKLRLYGRGHYLTGYEQTVFMAPALLLHYILDYRYRPPEPFVHAVIEGRFLTPDDLLFERPDA